nr:E3 SUMO-protein ligase ZBED1-like [Misgurnus anguillicaudatus]
MAVWSFMSIISCFKVKCLLCHKELTYSNNTSSMLRHYRALHEHAQTTVNPQTSQISKKEMVNEALVNMIIKDSQPFSIVEDAGFRELLQVLDPTYVIPTRKALKGLVENKYRETKEKTREQLQKVVSVSLTSDMWTSLHMDAYLAVTCHFINEEDKLCTTLLDVQHFPKCHTAENLATGHMKIMEEWGIKDKVKCLVTDAAANMIACVRTLNVRHAICIAHALNLIVKKSFDDISSFNEIRIKCRKLVTFFRTSTTAKERLAQVQEQMGRPVLKLIIEVDTRWNSTYNMLERLHQLREPVGAALASLRTDITPPTALEYEAVQDALHVLAPFHQATVELSGEKRVSASKVIPLMKMLHHNITNKSEGLNTNCARQLGDSLLQRVREKAVHLETLSVMTIPTLLDPRFKKI